MAVGRGVVSAAVVESAVVAGADVNYSAAFVGAFNVVGDTLVIMGNGLVAV